MTETKIESGIRYYLCSGEWMPSVTSILKVTSNNAALANWRRSRGDEADTISQQARERGTTIHEFAERRLRGYRAAPCIPEHLKPYWRSLQPIMRRCSHRRMTEQFVWHRQYGYAGTLDAVARLSGVETLIDFKTTKDASHIEKRLDDYRLQVTAYVAALADTYGIEMKQAAIAVAHPDGPAIVVTVPRSELDELWPRWCDRCEQFPSALAESQQRTEVKRAAVVDAFSRWQSDGTNVAFSPSDNLQSRT